MIKSTNNINRNTPIIAVTAYERTNTLQLSGIFDDTLSKPVTKDSVLRSIRQITDSLQYNSMWSNHTPLSSIVTTLSSFGSFQQHHNLSQQQQHQAISPISISKSSHFSSSSTSSSLPLNNDHHHHHSQGHQAPSSSSSSSILI